MGNCKTRKINNGAKYYFNNLDDLSTVNAAAPVNIDNGAMEQRVSLHVSLKNVDSTNPYKAELLIYSDTEGFDSEENLTINLEYPNLSYRAGPAAIRMGNPSRARKYEQYRTRGVCPRKGLEADRRQQRVPHSFRT